MDELMVHNPGVRSRFPTVILFADYNAGELMAIADGILKKQHLTATAGGLAALEAKLQAMVDAPDVQVPNPLLSLPFFLLRFEAFCSRFHFRDGGGAGCCFEGD
jgi:hypothetical protein